MDWNSNDLLKEFKRFKKHCNFTFKGPLADKSEEVQVNYLMTFIVQLQTSYWQKRGPRKTKFFNIWIAFMLERKHILSIEHKKTGRQEKKHKAEARRGQKKTIKMGSNEKVKENRASKA